MVTVTVPGAGPASAPGIKCNKSNHGDTAYYGNYQSPLLSRQQTHEHIFDPFGPGGGQRPGTGLAQDMQRAAGVQNFIVTEAFFVTIEMNVNFGLAYFQVR